MPPSLAVFMSGDNQSWGQCEETDATRSPGENCERTLLFGRIAHRTHKASQVHTYLYLAVLSLGMCQRNSCTIFPSYIYKTTHYSPHRLFFEGLLPWSHRIRAPILPANNLSSAIQCGGSGLAACLLPLPAGTNLFLSIREAHIGQLSEWQGWPWTCSTQGKLNYNRTHLSLSEQRPLQSTGLLGSCWWVKASDWGFRNGKSAETTSKAPLEWPLPCPSASPEST